MRVVDNTPKVEMIRNVTTVSNRYSEFDDEFVMFPVLAEPSTSQKTHKIAKLSRMPKAVSQKEKCDKKVSNETGKPDNSERKVSMKRSVVDSAHLIRRHCGPKVISPPEVIPQHEHDLIIGDPQFEKSFEHVIPHTSLSRILGDNQVQKTHFTSVSDSLCNQKTIPEEQFCARAETSICHRGKCETQVTGESLEARQTQVADDYCRAQEGNW